MDKKFEIREKVKVYTRFGNAWWETPLLLPDDALYFGESYIDGNICILWHGCLHSVKKEEVYKLDEEIIEEKNA